MKREYLLACVSALSVLLLSCDRSEVIIDGGSSGTNVPVYSSLPNSFTYTISASRLTVTHTIPLNFTNNRLLVAAAVARFQGTAIFTLLDSLNMPIYADTFSLSGTYRVLDRVGTPRTVSVSYQEFSGLISYVLVADSLIEGMLISQFPSTEGSQWVYARYDSNAHRRDTVTVRALGLVTVPANLVARIWQRTYSDGHRDTQYVSITADTLRIFSDPNNPSYGAKFVFPLLLFKRWAGDFSADSSRVAAVGSITVAAGQFISYLVEEQWATLNDHGLVRTWLVPRVGLVRIERRSTWAFTNESWELLSYTIH